jgi:hypothetical protein
MSGSQEIGLSLSQEEQIQKELESGTKRYLPNPSNHMQQDKENVENGSTKFFNMIETK